MIQIVSNYIFRFGDIQNIKKKHSTSLKATKLLKAINVSQTIDSKFITELIIYHTSVKSLYNIIVHNTKYKRLLYTKTISCAHMTKPLLQSMQTQTQTRTFSKDTFWKKIFHQCGQ